MHKEVEFEESEGMVRREIGVEPIKGEDKQSLKYPYHFGTLGLEWMM